MRVELPRRRLTLRDVAERAGVDRSVVSRVISGDRALSVRESTRERVQQAIRELDYRPNAQARSLRTARAQAFGLLIPDFTNPIYASIIGGAELEALQHASVLLVGSSAEQGFRTQGFLDALDGGRVDGLLLAGDHGSERLFGSLSRLGIPWLMLNRRASGVQRSVILDDEGAASLAVRHLVHLGHRRIGHLAGPLQADTAQRRLAGYYQALKEAGLPSDPALVEAADYSSSGGAAAMNRLLEQEQPPTAVFVANIASAIGALHAARLLSLRVPDDVSVIAMHDLPLAGYLDPPLTTVRMPLEALGRRGVELLVSHGASDPIDEVLRGPIELVVRGSSAPPGATRR